LLLAPSIIDSYIQILVDIMERYVTLVLWGDGGEGGHGGSQRNVSEPHPDGETTMTAVKTSQRACKVIVQVAGAKRPTVFRFENGGVNGRAAKFMQKTHPISEALTETTAKLLDGGTLTITRGCTVGDLYPITASARPAKKPTQPEPEPVAEVATPVEEVTEQPTEAPVGAPAKGKKSRKPAAKKGRKK
jgi:hypothetical protein